MKFSIRRFAETRPFTAGIVATLTILAASASLTAAATHFHRDTFGTINYESTTSGPIIEGVQDGSGIGVEGVTNTGAAAGSIALNGFGTSTTHATVGVNGSVDGPGSTALIGNANATTGAPSVGLEGFSQNGEGVLAQSLSASFTSLRSLDGVGNYDVRLSDAPEGNGVTSLLNNIDSGGAAIEGFDTVSSSSFNNGVEGVTTSGLYGVVGYAGGNSTAGVFGQGDTDGQFGVLGISNSGGQVGVRGESTSSVGVEGSSSSSDGVAGESTTGFGVYAASAGGVAIVGTNSSGNGADVTGSYIGVIGRAPASGGFPIVATDQNGNDLFYVDGAGNLFIHGTYNTFIATRGGFVAAAYGSKSTSPTVEDTGSAQLVNGAATVPLDSAFAQTIDPRTPYHVMLTPDGDTRGLFVASKGPNGFVVREVQGGHNSLAFDYHIYAPALGQAGQRMVVVSRATAASWLPRVPVNLPARTAITRAMAMNRAPMVNRAQKLLAMRGHLHTIVKTNMYEPHFGADGKLHSQQIQRKAVASPRI